MKKYYAIIAVFLAARLLAACAQPTPAPEESAPSPAPTANAAPGEAQTLLTWHEEPDEATMLWGQCCWSDGVFYRLYTTGDTARLVCSAADGTAGEVELPVPTHEGEMQALALTVVDGYAVADIVLYDEPDPAGRVLCGTVVRFAAAPDRTTVTPLTLAYLCPADFAGAKYEQTAVDILGQSDSEVFVLFEEQLSDAKEGHGNIRCGLLPFADLLSGTPNYREVAMPCGLYGY